MSFLERKGVSVEYLRGNESLVSTVAQASTIAIRNHERVKLDALRNAVLIAALPHAQEDSLQQMCLTRADRFTEWHLRVLQFFDEPRVWFEIRSSAFSGDGVAGEGIGQSLLRAIGQEGLR
jgi:hypothetical protein